MTRSASPAAPLHLDRGGSHSRTQPTTRRRTEIEGLRTVAALLVATYHVWFGKVSGGVDVFFVVTGFLITLTLVGHVRDHGRIRPIAYLGRLARRIWPAAAIVLLAVLAITVTIAPAALRPRNFTEVLTSALYVENWFLSASAVDYLDSQDPHTPVQHFWAMSLQGQFYLIWLILGLIALGIATRRRMRFVAVFAVLIAAATVASFAWSLLETAAHQPAAYFSTLTRIWEFGVGALLALAGRRILVGGAAAGATSWVAMVGLVACGIVLPVAGIFPGWAALWPVACAALLLMSSRRDERPWSATRLLSARPLVWLGGMAFGIYLWHWPLLVAYRYLRGAEATPGPLAGSAIIAGAVVLAIATHMLVERPVARGWRMSRSTRSAIAALLIGSWVAVAATAGAGVARSAADAAALADGTAAAAAELDDCFGASALDDPVACTDLPDVPLTPERSALLSDTGGAYACYTAAEATTLKVCSYGSGPVRVALIGNSHAAMFGPPLGEIADELGWTLDVMVGNGCVWNAQRADDPDVSERCKPRLAEAESRLFGEPYDVVVFAGGRGSKAAADDEIARIADNWRELQELGTRVVIIEDNPRIGDSGAACVVAATDDELRDGRCDTGLDEATSIPDRYVAVAESVDGAAIVRMMDQYCRDGSCPAVIGEVVVYRDAHHVTGTFTRTTMPSLVERLRTALG